MAVSLPGGPINVSLEGTAPMPAEVGLLRTVGTERREPLPAVARPLDDEIRRVVAVQ